MTFHIACNRLPLQSLSVFVPGVGPWFAEMSFADEAATVPSGPVEISIGDRIFKATIPPEHDGSFGLQRSAEAFAGAGGWSKTLKARSYRNDAGVKASRVISDAAAECGETVGTLAPGTASLGSHYTRESGFASRAIDDVSGGVPWWVDYAGVTHVVERTTTDPDPSAYQVLAAWPDRSYVQLALDDVFAVGIGSTLTERLPAPVTVKSLEIHVKPDSLRMLCYTFAEGERSKMADALTRIARAAQRGLFGIYRYRVTQMSGDRVDLQIAKKKSGLPDQLSVPQWPGLAGSHTELTKGCEVLVQFIDGERSAPAITNFVGKGHDHAKPQSQTIGGPTGVPIAYKGGTVKVLTPPAIFSGTINGLPATGVVTWQTAFTLGQIEVGAEKTKVDPT